MTKKWAERDERETQENLAQIRVKVANGKSPEQAINETARTASAYSAALKEYNLKPVIPD